MAAWPHLSPVVTCSEQFPCTKSTHVPRKLQKSDSHSEQRMEFSAIPRVRPVGTGPELYALRKDLTQIGIEFSLSPI